MTCFEKIALHISIFHVDIQIIFTMNYLFSDIYSFL